jgi:hypothetical protein
MNSFMVKQLIIKDWQIYKGYMFLYALLGAICAGLMTVPSGAVYYLGVVGLITVLIGASAHVSIDSIVTEKKESQLSFIMALPITPNDYTISKLFGSLGIYLVCWCFTVGVAGLTIYFSHMPNGMLPMLLICSLEILVATTVLLCTGVLSGSVPVTIAVMVVLNIFFNLFLFMVAGIDAIGSNIESASPVFNSAAITLIAGELLVIILLLAITIYIKSRKACFL